jgi:Flp pilus assembly protein TadD
MTATPRSATAPRCAVEEWTMAKRTTYIVRETPADATPASANLLIGFVAGILFGGLTGYLVGTQAVQTRVAVPAVQAAPAAAVVTPIVNDQDLQMYRNILAADPMNANAAVELGNRLYDAGRFSEAIPYYRQALTIRPKDVNVSTDLGTALWNVGRADDALMQFDRSLAVDPKHPQTLFNVGIVLLNGKSDATGAIASWERLLASNPTYPEQAKVRQLIADARAK